MNGAHQSIIFVSHSPHPSFLYTLLGVHIILLSTGVNIWQDQRYPSTKPDLSQVGFLIISLASLQG